MIAPQIYQKQQRKDKKKIQYTSIWYSLQSLDSLHWIKSTQFSYCSRLFVHFCVLFYFEAYPISRQRMNFTAKAYLFYTKREKLKSIFQVIHWRGNQLEWWMITMLIEIKKKLIFFIKYYQMIYHLHSLHNEFHSWRRKILLTNHLGLPVQIICISLLLSRQYSVNLFVICSTSDTDFFSFRKHLQVN